MSYICWFFSTCEFSHTLTGQSLWIFVDSLLDQVIVLVLSKDNLIS